MNEFTISNNEELIMKLLHYFITEYGYNPIILHGAKDEIWLENMSNEYKIIRISSNYIHNNEQLNYDLFKTKQILKSIKKKTLTFKLDVLNIFLNLGDNVNIDNLEGNTINHITLLNLKTIEDFNKHPNILSIFPTITQKTNFTEKGMQLFMKLTEDINKKNLDDTKKAEDLFIIKKPIITYALIFINVVMFLLMYIFGYGSRDVMTLLKFGASYNPLIKAGQIYRLITSSFLHVGLLHLAVNMYGLFVIGRQLESFYGKFKFLIIYLFSAVTGNLLSMLFANNTVGAGASGAIFGLLGSLLYFGYHYRVYLGTTIKSQIIPLIILNLLIGTIVSGIDNVAHIGGLIGGILISMAVGVKYKSTTMEKINGYILTTIFTLFLIYMNFFA